MIAVLTAPRLTTSYLARTLVGIDASARSTNKVVICDGEVPVLPPGWRAEPFIRPVPYPHNKWAAWRAFDLALEAGEDLTLFEDDLSLCKNAAAVIENYVVPDDIAFMLFYAPWSGPPAIWRAHINAYVFAQCLRFPLRSLKTLCALRPQMEACRLGGSDECIKAVTMPLNWFWGVHKPGLVQHIGADSAVGNGLLRGTRISQDYPGDAFDALSLRRDHYY